TLARQDGIKPRIWNDFYSVREACQAVQRRYGLRVTAPGDRTAGRRPTRTENEHAQLWTFSPDSLGASLGEPFDATQSPGVPRPRIGGFIALELDTHRRSGSAPPALLSMAGRNGRLHQCT